MKIENVLRNKLHDELIEKGIVLKSIEAIVGDSQIGADIDFAEGTDMGLVQQIIDAHDPTPLPPQPTTEERLKMAEETILFLLMGGM